MPVKPTFVTKRSNALIQRLVKEEVEKRKDQFAVGVPAEEFFDAVRSRMEAEHPELHKAAFEEWKKEDQKKLALWRAFGEKLWGSIREAILNDFPKDRETVTSDEITHAVIARVDKEFTWQDRATLQPIVRYFLDDGYPPKPAQDAPITEQLMYVLVKSFGEQP